METGAPTREGEDRRRGELHAVCLPGPLQRPRELQGEEHPATGEPQDPQLCKGRTKDAPGGARPGPECSCAGTELGSSRPGRPRTGRKAGWAAFPPSQRQGSRSTRGGGGQSKPDVGAAQNMVIILTRKSPIYKEITK